ncbi:MAG TPA: 2,3-bisphosphoglycerate-independent phosphoglycerate mutase [candidate division Zixibacteria bacterium]|nr:2,3-bisphosphoglycerate-independent phosphoglycerate mutase [candidate division Zixibacteria bacterium]
MYQLKKLNSFRGRNGPLLLIIMDGIGLGKEDDGNAVYLARPKTLLQLTKECKEKNLYCTLKAHGPAVGMLSDNDMGNSEVGHNALGAGQIYDQGAKLVDESIKSGAIFQTDIWKKLTSKVKRMKKTVHLIGLLSDGNVHSNISQLIGLIEGFEKVGINQLCVHILTDGRDVPAHSALEYIQKLEKKLNEINQNNLQNDYNYRIASGGGRMQVTMDRYESDWKIVERGWNAHVLGIVEKEELVKGYQGYYKSAQEAIIHARKCFPEKNDQTLPPFVIVNEKNEPVGKIVDNDLVVNFNFRGDRAIQISKAFEDKEFNKFDRKYFPKVDYAGLMQYDGDKLIPKQYLVYPPTIKNILSDYCCANSIPSFAIAETHKFGHVTYFWNGNRTGYLCEKIEEFVEIKSDPNEMIPIHPEMKAKEVCERTIEALKSGKFKFLRVNFANGDMVGHTGIIEAAVKAVSIVDDCIQRLVEVVNELNGITIITADHGNCDDMKFPDGKTKTAHSLNPVGFWIVDKNWQKEYSINSQLIEPGLSNVASTLLNLIGYEKPENYRESLIKFN